MASADRPNAVGLIVTDRAAHALTSLGGTEGAVAFRHMTTAEAKAFVATWRQKDHRVMWNFFSNGLSAFYLKEFGVRGNFWSPVRLTRTDPVMLVLHTPEPGVPAKWTLLRLLETPEKEIVNAV